MSYSITNHITWLGPVDEVSGSAMLGTTTIVSADIAALPDVAGMGNVASLQSTHKHTPSNAPQYHLAA